MRSLIFTDPRGNSIKKPKSAKVHWRISAYAYIRRGKSILMIRDGSSEQWELPGGGIEVDESIAEGLARECYEETGYRVRIFGDPLYTFERYYYSMKYKKFYHTLSTICAGKLMGTKQNTKIINTVIKGEVLEVAWQPIKNISKLDCHPMFKSLLKTLQ